MNTRLVSVVAGIGVFLAGRSLAQGTPPPQAAAAPAAAAPASAPPVSPGPVIPAPVSASVPGAAAGPGATSAPAPTPVAGGFLTGEMNRELPDRPPPEIQAVVPEPGGLTSDEVVRRALAVSAPVKVKRAQLAAAEERITQTTWQFVPRLTAQASYTRVNRVGIAFSFPGVTVPPIAGVVDNYALTGRLAVPLSDYILRISDAAASSKAGRNAARYAVRAQELQLDVDARRLYFDWLRARGEAEIAAKSVERIKARLEDARTSFKVGVISKGDLLRIEAQYASAEARATGVASRERLVYGQLAIIMQDWHPSYKVGEGIPLPQSVAMVKEPVEQLIRDAQTNRMEVKAVDEQVALFRRGASATRAGALPRIDATGDVTYANPNQRYFPPSNEWNVSWSVGVAASWTLGETFVNSAAARELEAEAAGAEASRTELRANIASQVLAAYLDLGRARDNYAQQLVALAAAEEGYRVTTDLFKAGRATGTNLIDSENDLLNAKSGEINARIDLVNAALVLRHATAQDLPEAERAQARKD